MEIDNTMDQYEKQLHTLFTSFSAHDGSLSREALEKLCNTLQLETRGRQLIELLLNDSKELCVTFPMFRDGLLTVLGSESSESSVKILDRSELNSGEDSSGREVSPKFIFGSKKYGRRSKPSRSSDSADHVLGPALEAENSSIEAFEADITSTPYQDKSFGNKKRKSNKLKRSLSFSGHKNCDNNDNISDRFLSKTNKHLTLSKTENFDSISIKTSLPYQVATRDTATSENGMRILDFNSNTQISLTQPICFENIIKNTDSEGLDNCLQSIANHEMIAAPAQLDREEAVSTEDVVELWEATGVTQPLRLLADLGFSEGRLLLSNLIFVLEEEIQGVLNNMQENFTTSSLITLFQAALSLYQYDRKSLKLSLNHTFAERDKLRSDLSDANQRAILLAHEVDDNHAKMENAARNNFKQLEQKHSEKVKLLSEQLITEKEQLASSISALENQVSAMESDESKLKSQLSQLNEENLRFEKELNCAQEQIYELTEIKKQLSREIKSLVNEKQNKTQDGVIKENDVSLLKSQIDKLQNDNTILNDKNDELCAELEDIKATQLIDKLKFSKETSKLINISNKNCNNQSESLNMTNSNDVNRDYVWKKVQQTSDLINQEIHNKTMKQILCHNNLTSFENNIQSSDYSNSSGDSSHSQFKSENGLNFVLESENYHNLDVIIYIQRLSPQNVEELISIFKATTTTLSDFFIESKMKQYYLGFYILFRKVMADMKVIIEHNKNNCFDTNLNNLIVNIVNELCHIDIDDHQLLQLLTNSANVCRSSLRDIEPLTLRNESISKPIENGTSDPHIADMELKIKDLIQKLESEQLENNERRQKDLEKYTELESNMELLKNEYDKCEDYWASKLNEERDIYDQEQRITDEKFAELLTKLSEYEEQFASQDVKNDRYDGPLSTIEEKYNLEKQFTDLEDEFEEYKCKTEHELNMRDSEICKLKEHIEQLEKHSTDVPSSDVVTELGTNLTLENGEHSLLSSVVKCEKEFIEPIANVSSSVFVNGEHPTELPKENILEKISSPIDYLWNQSTISSPLPSAKSNVDITRDYRNPAFFKDQLANQNDSSNFLDLSTTNPSNSITPIQKPFSSLMKSTPSSQKSPNVFVSEKKMLLCSELEEELQGRRREVQQLEATRARLDAEIRNLNYQRSNPQSQVGAAALKAVALENYCRQLQTALRQQHTYAEAIMQQNIAAHRGEVGALRQRLAAADLLVRDLFVENCQLARSLTTSATK